jgi:eukaryotic-like serine/threonine-protein kinase
MIRSVLKIMVMGIIFLGLAGLSAYLTITLLLGSEKKISVPDLVGRDLIHVLETLTDLGLNPRLRELEYSADIPKNHVMAQHPAPGASIKKGRDIRITISKGAKSLAMPNLNDLDLRQARLILDDNGLCLGRISRTHHPTVAREAVIAQAPLPGRIIQRNRCADLLISMGPMPEEYLMPDLTGLYLDQAIRRIEHHRLRVGDIQSVVRADGPANLILDQDPPAGSRILREAQVNLKVQRVRADDDDIYRASPSGVLFRHRLPDGYLRHHVRLTLRAFGMSVDIHDELMRPGTDIWVLIPAHVSSALFLYVNDELVETRFYD